jgi:hypothetical protein
MPTSRWAPYYDSKPAREAVSNVGDKYMRTYQDGQRHERQEDYFAHKFFFFIDRI